MKLCRIAYKTYQADARQMEMDSIVLVYNITSAPS